MTSYRQHKMASIGTRIFYPLEQAAVMMNVPTETLKKSAWSRPMNGGNYVSEFTIIYWNSCVKSQYVREKLMLPKRRFMEYMAPMLADMPENDQNTMLDAFNVLLKELKYETKY